MRRFLEELKDFPKKGDMVLLVLCLVVAGFGCVCIASATSAEKFGSNLKYIVIQLSAIGLGVMVYALISSIDVELISEHRGAMVAFNTFLLFLLIPFGNDAGTGNRSWIDFPLMPVMIQPAEICKITYVLIMASVMASHQNNISKVSSVMHMVMHLGLLVGLNMVLSRDAGVSLIFVFIFIGMAFAGGVSIWWFALAIGGIAAMVPVVWPFLGTYQQERIMILIDPEFDKQGIGARYHSKINLQSLTGGGLTGQGLFNGNRTQGGNLYAQHTDYIFSSMGEELGFFGCVAIMILEFAIIARCIYVGMRSQDYMRRLICFGAASALMFQLLVNVGMCIGVMPVIGLTLPLISYGGSSVVSIFAMLGLVSGSYARPQNLSHERYIQPYRG
jgi:rod shape determining protein RodA